MYMNRAEPSFACLNSVRQILSVFELDEIFKTYVRAQLISFSSGSNSISIY
jgi:hypothetical protein